jgi:hypothetical protein
MKIGINSYSPFQDQNYQNASAFIKFAREAKDKSPEGKLASALIHTNAIDYLAGNVLQNLKIISYLTTYNELHSVFYIDIELDKKPLGDKINNLQRFEFPDKKSFIEDLVCFNSIRIKVIHNLLRYSQADMSNLDKDFNEFIDISERLMSRYDSIVMGIKNMWQTYYISWASRNGINSPAKPNNVYPNGQEVKTP